jgi:hypothetical protein
MDLISFIHAQITFKFRILVFHSFSLLMSPRGAEAAADHFTSSLERQIFGYVSEISPAQTKAASRGVA